MSKTSGASLEILGLLLQTSSGTPAGFIDATAIPRDGHMRQSFLALLSKPQVKECLTYVDMDGCSPIITSSGFGACGLPQNLGNGQKEQRHPTILGVAPLATKMIENLKVKM